MPPINESIRAIAQMIDHTLLKPEATYQQIDMLCQEALQFHFAAVCVHPTHVRRCAKQLQGSPVQVCTVVGFPLGANLTSVKVFEACEAIASGATELDMVINIGAVKSNDLKLAQSDISAVVETCHQKAAICKVIIETCLLSDTEKENVCRLVQAAGADFVKTSTGLSIGGATVEDVQLMRRIVNPTIGIKAAGGIRDLETARAMIDAGANRIGTSASIKIIQEILS